MIRLLLGGCSMLQRDWAVAGFLDGFTSHSRLQFRNALSASESRTHPLMRDSISHWKSLCWSLQRVDAVAAPARQQVELADCSVVTSGRSWSSVAAVPAHETEVDEALPQMPPELLNLMPFGAGVLDQQHRCWRVQRTMSASSIHHDDTCFRPVVAWHEVPMLFS